MGIMSWDLRAVFSSPEPVRNSRLTIRCEYPDMAPTEVTFRLACSYGIPTAREAHDWFLSMMRAYDEFEVASILSTKVPREIGMSSFDKFSRPCLRLECPPL